MLTCEIFPVFPVGMMPSSDVGVIRYRDPDRLIADLGVLFTHTLLVRRSEWQRVVAGQVEALIAASPSFAYTLALGVSLDAGRTGYGCRRSWSITGRSPQVGFKLAPTTTSTLIGSAKLRVCFESSAPAIARPTRSCFTNGICWPSQARSWLPGNASRLELAGRRQDADRGDALPVSLACVLAARVAGPARTTWGREVAAGFARPRRSH